MYCLNLIINNHICSGAEDTDDRWALVIVVVSTISVWDQWMFIFHKKYNITCEKVAVAGSAFCKVAWCSS